MASAGRSFVTHNVTHAQVSNDSVRKCCVRSIAAAIGCWPGARSKAVMEDAMTFHESPVDLKAMRRIQKVVPPVANLLIPRPTQARAVIRERLEAPSQRVPVPSFGAPRKAVVGKRSKNRASACAALCVPFSPVRAGPRPRAGQGRREGPPAGASLRAVARTP
jgi:hypothetical protein